MSIISVLNDIASPWATMLDASFRGVKFHVAGISDRGEKALAVHEYPYRPGAEVEDLGRRPRAVPVKAIFWGRNYVSEVSALIKAFEESGKGELVHPLFGTLQVCVKSWSIDHDAEKRDYAAVDFEFVEASLDNPFFDAKSMYSQEGAYIHIKQGRVIEAKCDEFMLDVKNQAIIKAGAGVVLDTPQTTVTGNMTATGEKGDTVEMTANVKVKGDITQDGDMTSTGDHTAGGISLTEHTHTGVQPGGGNTGQPQ